MVRSWSLDRDPAGGTGPYWNGRTTPEAGGVGADGNPPPAGGPGANEAELWSRYPHSEQKAAVG